MVDFGSGYDFPKGRSVSSKQVLTTDILTKGDPGKDALFGLSNPSNIPVPCESDGSSPDFTNALTLLYVIKGGEIQSGWDWEASAEAGISVTLNNSSDPPNIAVTAMSIDFGIITLTASKLNQEDITVRVYCHKVPKGEQGIQGPTGSGVQGIQGAQGNDGADGTGLVTKVYKIDIQELITTAAITNDSGALITLTDHGFEAGQVIGISGSSGEAYDGTWTVSQVIDSDNFRVSGMTYTVDDSSFNIRDYRKLLSEAGFTYEQLLKFPNIFPVDSVPQDVMLILRNPCEDEYEIFAYMGYADYPDTGHSQFINGSSFKMEGDYGKYNYDLYLSVLYPSSYYRNVYLRIVNYPGREWDRDYEDLELALCISYKYYNFPD